MAIGGKTLQWGLGLFCAVIGTQILVVPHQFATPAYDALRPIGTPWGTGALLFGMLMVVAAATNLDRRLVLAAHAGVGLVLGSLAVSLAGTGGAFGAVIYAVLALGAWLAPAVARAPRGTLDPSDLLAIVLALAVGVSGLAVLVAPGWFAAPLFDALRPTLAWHGLSFVLASGLVVGTQLRRRTPWWGRWLSGLALACTALLPLLVVSVSHRLWAVVVLYGGAACYLATLPALGAVVARIDPGSLRTRLALTLGVSTALALVAIVALDSERDERALRGQALAGQQALAQVLAQDVSDFVAWHEAAARALAASPRLMDLRPDEQADWLRVYASAYPEALGFGLFDARGEQLARSDGRPPVSVAEVAWFKRIQSTGEPQRLFTFARSIQRPVIGYAAPILAPDGSPRGVLTVAVVSTGVAERIARTAEGYVERAYLVDATGQVIAHPDEALVAGAVSLRASPPVAALLAASDERGSVAYRDVAGPGDEWLAGYARLPALGWGIVVEQPAADALAIVRSARERAFGALALIVAIMAAVGALAAGWLVRPLGTLSLAVRRLADGADDVHLGTGHVTEIGRLAGTFAEMRARLVARTSEHARSEAALRESEQRFRTMANSAPVMIWMSGPDAGSDFFSDGWLQFTGRTLDQELGNGWTSSIHPDDRGARLRTYLDASAARQPFEIEYRLRRADGEYCWIVERAAPRLTPDGTFAGYIGSCSDITERRAAEDALRLSEERLRMALEAGRMGSWDWNVTTNELAWAGRLEEIHGLVPGSFDGTFASFVRVIHPDDLPRVQRAIQDALAVAGDFAVEFRVTWPDGSTHWIAGLGRAYRDERGNPSRMVGIGLEVTNRRRAVEVQRLLAEAGSRLVSSLDYETTLRGIADLMVKTMADYCIVKVLDEDGTWRIEVAHADASAAELVRRRLEAAPWPVAHGPAATGSRDRLLPGGSGAPDALREGAAGDQLPGGGTRGDGPAPDGTFSADLDDAPLLIRWVEPGTPWPSASSRVAAAFLESLGARSLIRVPLLARERTIGALLLISVESGRRYDDDDLALTSALAARAALAVDNARLYREAQAAVRARDEFLSIASHELRTPVAGIKGYAQLLARAKGRGQLDEERLARSLRSIDGAADRLTTLTQDLLDVSRIRLGQLPLRVQPVDLGALVRRVTGQFAEHVAAGREIVVTVEPGDCTIEADADRLEQVVSNLLENAVKYSPDGGTIDVSLGAVGVMLVLSVRDQGIGLPPDATESIFRPFGRAPNAARQNLPGMGLGLYICRNIVERHGGWIVARSDGEGRGTTVEVGLPRQGLLSIPTEAVTVAVGSRSPE